MAADFAEDLHHAVADVLDAHGLGMLSRLVVVAELVDEDGGLNLIRGSCPVDMPIWDELGLHRYALADIDGHVTAVRVTEQLGNEEE